MITTLLWGTTWSPTNMVRARQESLTTKRAAPHTPRIHDEDDALRDAEREAERRI